MARCLVARWLVLLWLLVEWSEALSVGSTRRLELLRVPTSDALCAPTKPELVEEVLSATAPLADAIDRLALPDLPHRWSDAELDELQWEPLATAARQQRQRLAALSPEEVRAHDLVEAHAIACDGLLWLVPATAGWGRSAPRGAYLTRCHLTDALILVADATADGETWPEGDSGRGSGGDSGRRRGMVDKAAILDENRTLTSPISSGWRSNAGKSRTLPPFGAVCRAPM